MTIKKFLNLIGYTLRKKRPLVPTNHNYTIKDFNGFIHFWFRTQGCKYVQNKNGGCLMCDYSTSSKSNIKEMKQYILEGLKKINNPYLLLINSSGSFLDENEVPKEIRITIYKELTKLKYTEIIFETLLETITETKLNEIREILTNHIINIEFGIETVDKNILKYCINKNINIDSLENKIELLHKYKMNSVGNILLGIPFLSEFQNIELTLKSINSLLNKGIDNIVLFPVNIKPYTLTYWLYQKDLYTPISLWSYIEVLNKIEKNKLSKIELSWYKDTTKNPIYQDGIKAPTTCPKCKKQVLSLLDEFSENRTNRSNILNKLNKIKCKCKNDWKSKLRNTKNDNLVENLINNFNQMANDILGNNFWEQHKNNLIKEIKNDFKPL